MDYRGFIDVTALDLRKLVAAAFAISNPQGMGFLHHKPGDLSDAELDVLLRDKETVKRFSLDYVRGRSMKFHLYFEDGHRYWQYDWYDHTPAQQQRVLIEAGMPEDEAAFVMAKAHDEQAVIHDELDKQANIGNV